jgi:hypothetical protein
MIWTERHDEAINRTFEELVEALSSAKEGDEAKQKLQELQWPYGPQAGPETPSMRVRRELGNLAIVEHCKKLLEESIG